MLATLEILGEDIKPFLDRPGLLSVAQKLLKKGVPVQLQWFDRDCLPAVHWDDTGEAIEAEIVHGWLIQSFKLKKPHPDAFLIRYLCDIRRADANSLAKEILRQWLHRDSGGIEENPEIIHTAIKEKGILALVSGGNPMDIVESVAAYLKRWYGMRVAQCKALVEMLGFMGSDAATQLSLSTSRRFRTRSIRLEAQDQVNLMAAR